MIAMLTAGAGFEIPLPLGEVISSADVVAVGTIEKVSASTFTLAVDDVLIGKTDAKRIEIEKFAASAESPRWAPYARGQSVIVFLAHQRCGPFRILGRLGEGEIPLDAKFAYFHGRYVDVLQPDWYEVDGRRVYLQRFDRAMTMDAIRGFRNADGDYRSRSKLHEFLSRRQGLHR
ncbi:MAG TPA: hypothetical protein VEU30_16755 [Thermoanaerobaculia bacterium]|nr:hypothetical protein [Thermoanaerobaculia bacterium]